MKLSARPSDLPAATDVATALSSATGNLGHRPALTVLRPDRRDEQGFVSLSRWAAKGAHLLEIDCLLEPGDRMRVAGPASWPLAVACYAAWWAGITVTLDSAPVAVVDERGRDVEADALFAVGTQPDGAPEGSGTAESWTTAIQAFPDQPPEPGARPDAVAIDLGDGLRVTQRELLARARDLAGEGVVGLDASSRPQLWLPAVVRPVVTGNATVIVDGVSRDAAATEGVESWVP